MPGKIDVLFLVCCAAWLVCLPALLVIGSLSLLCYAVVSLVADRFSAASGEPSNVREIAQRLCIGNDVGH